MKRSILLSFLVIGAVAALITAATSATFSDQVTSNDNSFASGTLYLSVDEECGDRTVGGGGVGGGTACARGAAITATNLKPGDTEDHTFAIVNEGSIDGTLSITVTPNYPEGCGAANWTITPAPASAALAASADTTFELSVTLKSTALNVCQNVSLDVDVTFDLVQAA